MKSGLLAGLCVVLLLAVLVMVGIVAGQSRRESTSTPINTSTAKPGGAATAAADASPAELTMSPISPTRVSSPRPPSSAGPVAVHVLPPQRTATSTANPAQDFAVSPAPLATITPQALPSIALTQNGLPRGVPYAGEHDPIRIDSVTLSADEVRGGDIASARVITTSNAAALTARIGSYQINVPRVAPGIFSIAIAVPHLPLHNQTVDIIVTAIRSDGATAQTTVPLKVSF